MCLDLPGTPENGAEFGYPGNDAGRGPFPQIRVVGLGECGTRAVLGAGMSPLATGEQPLARRLLARLQPGDLLLADRNFLSRALLADVLAAGAHVLWRAKSGAGPPGVGGVAGGARPSPVACPAPPPPARPRRHPQPHQRLRMLFPLSASATSPPTSPSRSPSTATSSRCGPAAATSARPNGPEAGTRPVSPARLPG